MHTDVLGYAKRSFTPQLSPTTVKYKVIEVKPDSVDSVETIDQVMKYVDWVAHTRAGGDYSLVDAYILANGYTDKVIKAATQRGVRSYVFTRRPYRSQEWKRLKLVQYTYIGGKPALKLQIINS